MRWPVAASNAAGGDNFGENLHGTDQRWQVGGGICSGKRHVRSRPLNINRKQSNHRTISNGSSNRGHQYRIDENIDGSIILAKDIRHLGEIEDEVSRLGRRGRFWEIDGEDDRRRNVDGFNGIL